MEPQFDAKLTSKDGKTFLYIRGPFGIPGGIGFELRMVPVVGMKDWHVIHKVEEEET